MTTTSPSRRQAIADRIKRYNAQEAARMANVELATKITAPTPDTAAGSTAAKVLKELGRHDRSAK